MDPATYAARTNTEHAHQVALFMWAKAWSKDEPRLELMFAIPNGGQRNKAVASRMKAEGVKAGVPDIMLPVPAVVTGFTSHGLFIELKRPKTGSQRKGTTSEQQSKFWHPRLQAEGYFVATCFGWDDARRCICWYLGLNAERMT